MAERDATTSNGREGSSGAADAVRSAGEKARGVAGQLVDDVREAAQSLIEEQKARAAAQAGGVAQALRKTARDLHPDNELVARYAERAAEQIERLGESMRGRHLGEVVADIDAFARRQPTLFLVGVVAAGFVAGRFMAASAERSRRGHPGVAGQGDDEQRFEPAPRDRLAGYGRTAADDENPAERGAL